MLAADSVAINRLQIKGDKRTSQALVRELEQTSWAMPLPAHLQHAWILVRELHVSGKARDLRQQTAQQLDGQLQGAVRAIHGDTAAANAVWFASFPELLAFLLVDLALGKATQWYWSRWAYLLNYPKHEAIGRLLCEHCEYLPAVIIQLQSRQQLSLVWSQLSDGAAKTIVRELIRIWGLPSLNLWETDSNVIHPRDEDINQVLQAQAVLLSHWRPLLKGSAAPDGRVLLATALHGLTYTPLWLQQQPAALVQAFANVACKLSPRALASSSVEKPVEIKLSEKMLEKKDASPYTDQLYSRLSRSTTPAQEATPSTVNSATELETARKQDTHTANEKNSVNELSFHPNSKAVASAKENIKGNDPDVVNAIASVNEYTDNLEVQVDDTNLIDGYEFITRAGGFFYLLNPLNRLLTAERLVTQSNASVWHWLLDLYRVFSQNFPVLNELMDAPMQRFILQQLHPGATPAELQELTSSALSKPPGDFAMTLFADLHKQFGHTDFWQELNTSPGFFATSARVIATASHWDIYFPLQSVRLDLRLMGWDINPGWLPWLGRVVAFHYVEQPVLAGTGATT